MIRARREEDLDRLCVILETIEDPASFLSGKGPREWLEEHDAEQSWVFDMAPVTVAPTKNVVGHVQIYRPTHDSSTPYLVKHTKKSVSSLLAIGKFFVKPNTHEYGIGRYLLKESIKHIQGQGKLPVLNFAGNGFLSKGFCEKFGFEEIPSGDPGVAPMIYTK
jgi:ribosomal protein S18 acetylase RimI-like enzyme